MRSKLSQAFMGKGNFSNGLIALMIIGLIVLGCTCNDGKIDFGKKKDTNSSQEKDEPVKKEKDYEKADASKGEIPSEEELQDMVKADLLIFDKALKRRNFIDFYKNTSKLWQEQTTPGKLKILFKNFIEGKADVSEVENLEAEFSPDPFIDDSLKVKVMEVNGSFPTRKNPTIFELKYIAEGKEWKLSGFFVKTTVYNKK